MLLLSCSEGTRYANFQHDWVEILTEGHQRPIWRRPSGGACARTDVDAGGTAHPAVRLLDHHLRALHPRTSPGSRSKPTAALSAVCSTGMTRWDFQK